MKTLLVLVVTVVLVQLCNAQDSMSRVSEQPKDVLSTAASDSSLKVFVALAAQSGTAQMMRGNEHVTVFAFSDQAFAKLPPEIGREVLQQPRIATLLIAHNISRGEVRAKDLVKNLSTKALTGEVLRVDRINGTLRVQNSDVERTDIVCSNGVIHVLGSVDISYVYELLKRFGQNTPQ